MAGSLLGALLIGSIPGIIIGSRLTLQVNDRYVRSAVAVVLALVGARLLLR